MLFLTEPGNKCDLDSLREVNKDEAKTLAQSQQFIGAIETSAKENTNIDDTFLRMAKVSAGSGT